MDAACLGRAKQAVKKPDGNLNRESTSRPTATGFVYLMIKDIFD
jgi:hypothetical protein